MISSPLGPPTDSLIGSGGNVADPVRVHSASSVCRAAKAAIHEVAAGLPAAPELVLMSVPAGYDLAQVAEAMRVWPEATLIGCTSAGGIGPTGYAPDALTAVALNGGGLRARTIALGPLQDVGRAMADAGAELQSAVDEIGGQAAFAILLVDGLSMREEALTDALSARLDGIPLVGASAGDGLRFKHTAVLADGRFAANTATLTFVTTIAPWRRFRVQHHTAGHEYAVVTSADPQQRLVHSLNGRPAVSEYARLVGVEEEWLTPTLFSTHPLVLRAGGGEWVRAISRPEPDGSLRFFCAAESGDVLRLGESRDPVQTLTEAFTDLYRDLGDVTGALVFDCILRRLEFTDFGLDEQIGRLLSHHNASGFSTYGEQYDGVHVNQTMVGVAFGG